MKRIILTILLILIMPIQTDVQAAQSDVIGAIETNIFGYDYRNESDSKRLERIEMHLYGSQKSGNTQSRIQNIQNDIGFISEEEKNIQKAEQVKKQNEMLAQENAELMALKEDTSVEYPMVDKLEQEIFSTTYKNENIYNRLNRLEEKIFNKTSNEPLNDRVDKLASVVKPQIKKANNHDRYTIPQNMDSYYSSSGLEPVNDQSFPFQLAALEQDLLKNDYMDENNANRLSRLEEKLFKRTFANDSDITRLQRIMVAYDAKKNSYKYENNRKMQNMATISQIGGILLMILAILL